MHTLSIFPDLLTYASVGPLLLRLLLGGIAIYFGTRKVKFLQAKVSKNLGFAEIILGVLLVLGAFTQIAALLLAIMLFIQLVDKARNKALLTAGVNYYLILFIIAISLMFTGPGFFSIDLPL
ncbi:MAG: hypothetical protein V4526_02390 [Patescibacteria group bacterium]